MKRLLDFLLSWLMRNMGGFFIRRKLNTITPQDELYRAVMNEVSQTYMLPILSLPDTVTYSVLQSNVFAKKIY